MTSIAFESQWKPDYFNIGDSRGTYFDILCDSLSLHLSQLFVSSQLLLDVLWNLDSTEWINNLDFGETYPAGVLKSLMRYLSAIY